MSVYDKEMWIVTLKGARLSLKKKADLSVKNDFLKLHLEGDGTKKRPSR